MALDLSTREKRLEVATAAIWVVNTLKQAGELPQEPTFQKSYPKFTLNDILFIISNIAGVSSQQELKEKIDQVIEKLEDYRQSLLAQPEGSGIITRVPEEIAGKPQYLGLSAQDVFNEIKALELKIEAAKFEERVKDFSLPEKTPAAPTFYLAPQNPPEPQPVYEAPAEVLVEAGIVSEEGVPAVDYGEKIANPEFKAKIESDVKKAVLTEHLENILSQDLARALENKSWSENLTENEKRFIVRSVAESYAEEAATTTLPSKPENLPQIQETVKKKLQDQFSQERPSVTGFLDSVLSVNPNFSEIALRKKTVDEAVEAISQALSTFEPENIEVKLETQKPKVTVSHFKLIDNNPVREDFDYYIVPKSPEELEASYEVSKGEVETLLKVLFTKNKVTPIVPIQGAAVAEAAAIPTVPTPTPTPTKPAVEPYWLGRGEGTFLGSLIASPKPFWKSLWGKTVIPPVVATAAGAFALTNPLTAVLVLPTLAIGFKKFSQIKDTIEDLQIKALYFTAPAEVIEFKYKQALKKAAWAIPKALLFKTYYFETPLGTRYPYKDFRLTEILGEKLSKFLEGRAGGRTDSIFKKIAENLKPYYWDKKGELKKRDRRGPWGVIFGVVVVDVLGTIAGRLIGAAGKRVLTEARWLRLTRGLRTAGFVTRNVLGGVVSLNTAAGYLLGSAVGGPAVGTLGAALGAGYQIYLNFGKWIPELPWAKDVAIREAWVKEFGASWTPEYLAQAKPKLNFWQKLTYRPSVLLSEAKQLTSLRSGLLARVPLKGFALGFLIPGGNLLTAFTLAGAQLAWSSRGYLPKFALYKFSAGKYSSLAEFAEKGPRWARFLKGGRVLGGVGIGGALGYFAGGPLGALAGAAAGGASYFLITRGISYLSTKFGPPISSYLQTRFGPLRPYWKGTVGGFVFGAFLAGLGLNPALALLIGVGGGVGSQYLWRRFFSQIFAKGAAVGARSFTEQIAGFSLQQIYAKFGAAGVARFLLGKLIIPYFAFDLSRFLLKSIEGHFESYEAWRAAGGGGQWGWHWQYHVEKILVKGLIKALNFVLWIPDRLLDLLSRILGPLVSLALPLLGKAVLFLYKAGALVFGWTQSLPGFLGGWARNIGGFFKGVLGGAAQAFASAVLGLLGAIISLLTGGDIAEAAIIGAIGLVIGGSLLNAQTINSAFFHPPAPVEFEAQNPFFNIDKTIGIPSLGINPVKAITIKNEDLPRDDVKVVVIVTVKEKNLTNVICKDSAILHPKEGARKVIFETGSSFCPPELEAGKTHTFLLPRSNDSDFKLKNNQDFYDSIVINTAEMTAAAEGKRTPTGTSTATITIGNPPADCPSGWPTQPGFVSQGHDSPGPLGHARLHPEEAIDIAANTGTEVISTFDGIVSNADSRGTTGYGIQVRVSGVCNGVGFTAVFAHLQGIAANVRINQPIKKGGQIGWVNTSGSATGPHLHYSFFGLVPEPPYIPKFIEPTCGNDVYPGCGTVP